MGETESGGETFRRISWDQIRDVILFFAGLAGIAYETIVEHVDRPQLLLLFAAMVGLPAFLRRNGK